MKLNTSTGTVTLADGSQSDVIKELSLIGNAPSAAEAELEELAEAALEADIAAKAAVAKQESTKKALKEALDKAGKLNGDTKAVGVVRTIIKEMKRFDPEKAIQMLPKKLLMECSLPSASLVKARVAPAQYEQMQAATGFSLELKVDTGK